MKGFGEFFSRKFVLYGLPYCEGFPGSSLVKNLPDNAGDVGLIPGWGKSPGEGNGNLVQYSCLGNSMDRGSWGATDLGIAKDRTRQQWNNNNIGWEGRVLGQ